MFYLLSVEGIDTEFKKEKEKQYSTIFRDCIFFIPNQRVYLKMQLRNTIVKKILSEKGLKNLQIASKHNI